MEYIEQDKANGAGARADKKRCIFCDMIGEQNDVENLIVFRGKVSFVLMNRYPYANGHLMVAPYEHVARLDLLTPEQIAEIGELTQRAVVAIGNSFGAHGYNVGMNLGTVAGAGIKDHLHQHVVPRWNGDVNFMPVIGETKVLPDSLENSYRKIVNAWK